MSSAYESVTAAPEPPGIPAAPYFDHQHEAWVISRYRDVAAALRDPLLVPATARSTGAAAPLDGTAHAQFRADALSALAPARLQQLESQIAPLASSMVDTLPSGRPVDLVAEFARPWSLAVARIAAAVRLDDGSRLDDLARCLFEAACEPYDTARVEPAAAAAAQLANFFRQAPPWHLQMFVALAHSLPGFLGSAWMLLLQHLDTLTALQQDAHLLPDAIEELLRLAGPARAQFRCAIAPLTLGGCDIGRNQQVILWLDIANLDPHEFPDPHAFRFDRRRGNLAFGAGLHACVAGALIRSAAAVATRPLLARLAPGDWSASPVAGFAVRYVKSLTATLAA